jgi:YVTN family beta-propeller protein
MMRKLKYAVLFLIVISCLGQVSSAAPFAYITNSGSNNVSVIDTATDTVTATVENVDISSPYAVAVNPTGTKVYVTNSGSNTVSVIDTATNNVTATVPVGSHPYAVAVNPNGAWVYVANENSNNVSVINTTTNSVTATVNGLCMPEGVAVNPTGTKVYVTSGECSEVSVIDTANNTVTSTVNVDSYGVAVNPNGAWVYVTNGYSSGRVSVINTTTNTVKATVNVGSYPWGVAVNPTGTKVYVANSHSNTVSVIDTANNTVTDTVDVGSSPYGVAVNPTGTKVYVANQVSNTVSVIDTVTNTVTDTVNVGSIPVAFGQFITDTTPPASVTSLANISYASNYINWTWTDPTDYDLSGVMVYLNGTFQTNVTKGTQHYNAIGLSANTSYEISTRTFDNSGNINQSWVNHTSRTADADTTPSASITNLTAGSIGQTYINWTWTDPSDSDFSKVMIYLNGVSKPDVLKGVQYYYAGGLSADTDNVISTRTVDNSGNINQSWVNLTSRTTRVTSSGGSSGGYYPPPTATATATATPTPTTTAPVLLLKTITVSPSNTSIVVNNTKTFTASTYDQFGNPITIVVSWSSSNNSVGTIDAAGVFTASAPGKATITARSGDASGTAIVTVTPAMGYRIWLLTPLIFSDISQVKGYKMSFIANPTTSGFSRAVGNYKISLNLYSSGVGGVYNNNRYKLYLVPVQAHISYSNGITVNDPITQAPIKSFFLNYISTKIDNLLRTVVNLINSVI